MIFQWKYQDLSEIFLKNNAEIIFEMDFLRLNDVSLIQNFSC